MGSLTDKIREDEEEYYEMLKISGEKHVLFGTYEIYRTFIDHRDYLLLKYKCKTVSEFFKKFQEHIETSTEEKHSFDESRRVWENKGFLGYKDK